MLLNISTDHMITQEFNGHSTSTLQQIVWLIAKVIGFNIAESSFDGNY